MKSYDNLEAKRGAFNAYEDAVVKPALGLNANELDKLGFAVTAKHIDDPAVRRRYCELAVEMLDANIAHYRPESKILPVPEKSNSWVVASTLIASAIAYHFGGIISALVAAAAWYWLANETAIRRAQQVAEETRVHNESATKWAEGLQGWEAARGELRAMFPEAQQGVNPTNTP